MKVNAFLLNISKKIIHISPFITYTPSHVWLVYSITICVLTLTFCSIGNILSTGNRKAAFFLCALSIITLASLRAQASMGEAKFLWT